MKVLLKGKGLIRNIYIYVLPRYRGFAKIGRFGQKYIKVLPTNRKVLLRNRGLGKNK